MLTTLQFNFACGYCYQGDREDFNQFADKMTLETSARVADWIERRGQIQRFGQHGRQLLFKKMKQINVNVDIKKLFANFSKNLAWLFLILFLVLVALEALEVETSVSIVLQSNRPPAQVVVEKGSRINFDNYNWVVDRINAAKTFQPSGGISNNPFQGP